MTRFEPVLDKTTFGSKPMTFGSSTDLAKHQVPPSTDSKGAAQAAVDKHLAPASAFGADFSPTSNKGVSKTSDHGAPHSGSETKFGAQSAKIADTPGKSADSYPKTRDAHGDTVQSAKTGEQTKPSTSHGAEKAASQHAQSGKQVEAKLTGNQTASTDAHATPDGKTMPQSRSDGPQADKDITQATKISHLAKSASLEQKR